MFNGVGGPGVEFWVILETNCYLNSHLVCRTPDDECRSNPDCKDGSSADCAKTDVTGTWKCTDSTCTI